MPPATIRRPQELRAAARPPLRVETVSGRDAPSALGPDWDQLLDRQPVPSPLLATDWLRGVGADDPGAAIVLVHRGDALVAAGAFRRARVGPVTVGTWLTGARFPAILSAEREAGAAGDVVAAMLDRCHAVWLPRVPAVGATLDAIEAPAPWRRATAVEPPGYVVPLPPPRLDHARAKAAYARRRAARKGAHVRVCTTSRPDEIGRAFERLVDLYRARWRGRGQEGSVHSDVVAERGRYQAMLPNLAAHGRVRIVEVFEDATLVATLLGLLAGRGALFHTTATHTGGVLRGPGHLAMLAWARDAAAAGAETMYLGRGAGEPEGPKARLGAEPLALFDILAASSPRRQSALTALIGAKGVLSRMRHGSRT